MNPIAFRDRFGALIAPTTVDAFFAEHWERAPLHARHEDAGALAEALDCRDVDHLIARAASWNAASLEIVSHGDRHFAANAIKSIPVRAQAAANAFGTGSSLRIRGVQQFLPRLDLLMRDLEQFFGFPLNANLYYSPPGTAALNVHFDAHDALVLQLAGTKIWEVAPPDISADSVLLPLESAPQPWFDRRDAASRLFAGPQAAFAAAARSYAVGAGDVLYVPRGHWHRATATDAPSLHVTLGFITPTWADVLTVALRALIDGDPELRSSVPRASDPEPPGAVLARIAARTGVDRAVLERALRESTEALARTSQWTGFSTAARALPAGALGAATRVERTPGLVCWYQGGEAELQFRFLDRAIPVAARVRAAFDFVLATQSFAPADLAAAGLDAAGAVKFVAQLVAAGVLRASGAAPALAAELRRPADDPVPA